MLRTNENRDGMGGYPESCRRLVRLQNSGKSDGMKEPSAGFVSEGFLTHS